MPKIDLSCVPVETGQAWYPAPYQDAVAGLELQPVSRKSGLTQFAANLVRLAPGQNHRCVIGMLNRMSS